MADFSDLSIIGHNFVTYLFGNYLIFALIISAFFLIVLLTLGMEFKYAFPLMLPVVALFSIAGWFGNTTWVLNAILLVVGLIYAFAIIKMIGR